MKLLFEDKTMQGHFSISTNVFSIKGDGILNGKMQFLSTIVCNPDHQQEVMIDEIRYIMRHVDYFRL